MFGKQTADEGDHRLNWVSPESYVKTLTPDVTASGARALKEVTEVPQGQKGAALIHQASKKGTTNQGPLSPDTSGEKPHEHTVRWQQLSEPDQPHWKLTRWPS
jgi:hypothetical protein